MDGDGREKRGKVRSEGKGKKKGVEWCVWVDGGVCTLLGRIA